MTAKRIVLTIFFFALVALLVGCGGAVETDAGDAERGITRHIDEEAGVVCWLHSGTSFGVAMDCMPIGDTRLSVGR